MINNKHTRKYFLIGLLAATILVAIFLVKPYLVALLTSAVLAYVSYPLYQKIDEKINRENVSAFVVSLIIILIIAIPLAFVLYHISQEANAGYIFLKQSLRGGDIFGPCEGGILCSITERINDLMSSPEVQFYVTDSLKAVSSSITEGAFSFVFSLPKRVIDIFITFFITFFLLRDGKKLVSWIEKETPLKKTQRQRIFKQMSEVVRSIIYGFFLVALLEGTIIAITFKLAGLQSPIIWGLVVALLALIPIVGGAIVWIPAMILRFADGYPGAAVVVAIGGLIVSSIDTFWKPKVIGSKADIHPIVVVLGLFGGISLFGIAGVIIGPLILTMLVTFIKMYRKR